MGNSSKRFSNIEHPFGHPFLFAHDRERTLSLSLSLALLPSLSLSFSFAVESHVKRKQYENVNWKWKWERPGRKLVLKWPQTFSESTVAISFYASMNALAALALNHYAKRYISFPPQYNGSKVRECQPRQTLHTI